MGTIREPARAEAIKRGAKTYLTGRPCKYGHKAPRLVSSHDCTECQRLKCMARYHADIDASRTRVRAWQRANRETYLLSMRVCQNFRRAAPDRHTAQDVKDIFRLQRGKCAGCGKHLGAAYDVDHIMPLAKGGSNARSNIQILCGPCNRNKAAKDPIVWMQSRGHLL